ncbi:MAG TPA: ComEC/Rec2 family competence protein, partial [Actinobacteria bacterium]|nr:ComEC/Rec2 family competence protein [Actinomycetota bacterium]
LVLVVAPELAFDVGFQLSVAATVGVVAGGRAFVGIGPRWIALPLGVTLAAQLAVAPILLAAFGKLPLWSPIANLLAAPLVTAATVLGGLGAMGVEPATRVAVGIAGLVLKIARAVADLPTVGWFGYLAGLASIGTALRFPRLRPVLALGGIVLVAAGLVPRQSIEGPAIVFLDVGQGDAILLVGEDGGTVLVDGGPDPVAIGAALARHGVRRIDLAVVTHPDADHLVGILEVVCRLPVGLVWRPDPTGGDPRLDDLMAATANRNVPIDVPEVGDAVAVGGVRLTVIGPLRRYASGNDEGIVMVAEVGDLTVLLTGDTESTAQREYGMPSVDVLKVPHHGSNTTDLEWLASTDATVAVISVGDNDFGHPTPEILAVLESLSLEIRRTDLEGDVVLSGR